MGWYLDIFVEYLIRMAILSTKKYRTRAWPEIKASIMSAKCDPRPASCKVAEVYYKYYVDGLCYADVYREPFIWRDSGESYVCLLYTSPSPRD